MQSTCRQGSPVPRTFSLVGQADLGQPLLSAVTCSHLCYRRQTFLSDSFSSSTKVTWLSPLFPSSWSFSCHPSLSLLHTCIPTSQREWFQIWPLSIIGALGTEPLAPGILAGDGGFPPPRPRDTASGSVDRSQEAGQQGQAGLSCRQRPWPWSWAENQPFGSGCQDWRGRRARSWHSPPQDLPNWLPLVNCYWSCCFRTWAQIGKPVGENHRKCRRIACKAQECWPGSNCVLLIRVMISKPQDLLLIWVFLFGTNHVCFLLRANHGRCQAYILLDCSSQI